MQSTWCLCTAIGVAMGVRRAPIQTLCPPGAPDWLLTVSQCLYSKLKYIPPPQIKMCPPLGCQLQLQYSNEGLLATHPDPLLLGPAAMTIRVAANPQL